MSRIEEASDSNTSSDSKTLSEANPIADEPFIYKTSKAMKIWLAIVVAVLALLFAQTQDTTQKGYNVVVCADKGAIGSQLDVDGKKAAVFEDAEKHGLKGSITWLKLSPGEHLVELVEPGGSRVPKNLKVTGKHYLRFDSGKSQEPNASSLTD